MLDVRELAEELDELRERIQDWRDKASQSEWVPDEDDLAREKALELLENALGGDLHVFVNHGGQLVEDSDRKQIAQDAAEDQGVDFSSWPYTAIDWTEATDDYFTDWTCIEFDGETYWTRDV